MQRPGSELNGFVTPSAVQGFPSFSSSCQVPFQTSNNKQSELDFRVAIWPSSRSQLGGDSV